MLFRSPSALRPQASAAMTVSQAPAPAHLSLTHTNSSLSYGNSQRREVEATDHQQRIGQRLCGPQDWNGVTQPPGREFTGSPLSQEGMSEIWDATTYTDGVANCMTLSDASRSELHVFKQVSSLPML